MTLPPPPSTSSFSAIKNVNQLVALRALRTGTFARQGEVPQAAVWLDVWVLTGPEAGKLFSDSVNTSRLGRQFTEVAGNGQVYFGRVNPESTGNGVSYILGEPGPADQPMIDSFKARLAADPNLGGTQEPQAQPAAAAAPAAAPVDPWAQPQAQAQQAAAPATQGYQAPPF